MTVYALFHPQARSLAHSLLAVAAAREWGLSPCPELALEEHGKPYFQNHPNLHFNLSHSGSYALCALSDAPVGVDIQVVKSRRAALLDRVCSPKERQWLHTLKDSPHAFARLWAMKESRCKQNGTGLTQPITDIRVPLPHGDIPWHLEVPFSTQLDGLTFTLFEGPDWQGAACGQSTAGKILWLEERDLEDATGPN